MRISNTYIGITYPKVLRNKIAKWLWRKFMCTRHRHLFDEVWSPFDSDFPDSNHYLYCDACGLLVNIESVVLSDQQAKQLLKEKNDANI